MHTDTNELVHPQTEAMIEMLNELRGGAPAEDLEEVAEDFERVAMERALRKMEALKARGFQELPPEFDHAARCALQGEPRTTVSFKSKGKLSKWAARQRRHGRNRRS